MPYLQDLVGPIKNDTGEGQSNAEAVELLTGLVGGEVYAIAFGSTREIRSWTLPSSLPDATPHVLGVINLRGVVVPLLNLAACLGATTRTQSERNGIIVVELDETLFGLLVDAVSDIIAPAEDEMQSPPDAAESGDQSYVRALTLVDQKMVRKLKLASFLPLVQDAA